MSHKTVRTGPMPDDEIVALYFARSEEAIAESDRKYGKTCHTIAYNILHSDEDAEECVSDTWLRAWNAIPPREARPPGCLALHRDPSPGPYPLREKDRRQALRRHPGLPGGAGRVCHRRRPHHR